ncbi:hypothetical protein HZS_7274 [Henneguya salminicola]|nr:hypothetical protein HZS_7274 [Henneguya salminicola]
MIFRWMLCLIAINISIVYGPKCIYSLKYKHGDRISRKLYNAGVNITIRNEYSFKRKIKRDDNCNSINSSMINPARLFMSFSNNKDGKFCCGEQIRNCKNNRFKNLTTKKLESGEEFVKRVLNSCTYMTGYVYFVECISKRFDFGKIILELRLESEKSKKKLMMFNCGSDEDILTSWGHKIIFSRYTNMTVDVLNQKIYT